MFGCEGCHNVICNKSGQCCMSNEEIVEVCWEVCVNRTRLYRLLIDLAQSLLRSSLGQTMHAVVRLAFLC